ncbi:MAG: 2-hydroxyacid dehydrogenase [Paracoccaceae bacterium]
MSLLLDIRHEAWMTEASLAERLAPELPGVRIHVGPGDGPLDEVVMLATANLDNNLLPRLPKLELIQRLGAGVETMVSAKGLPAAVRVARLAAADAAYEIAEYCLAYVLSAQRNMAAHRADEAAVTWRQIAPRAQRETTIAVLGLGNIGGRTASMFSGLGFRVLGWSRSPKNIANVECRHGAAALPDILAKADHVCAILPSTPETRDLFDAATFARMKPGAQLINAGRGDLIVDTDLLTALDNGHVGHAVLDVFRTEPLASDHPYWVHPQVTVTPHVSGWRLDDSVLDVAENYLRLVNGRPLLNEVDRDAGY